MNDGQLDTAKAAYQTVLALSPSNEEAKKNLDDVQHRIDERGDPIKSKIAAAGMSEVYYQLGVGLKDEAPSQAGSRHRTEVRRHVVRQGRTASRCIANFDLSKTINDDIAAAKQEMAADAPGGGHEKGHAGSRASAGACQRANAVADAGIGFGGAAGGGGHRCCGEEGHG